MTCAPRAVLLLAAVLSAWPAASLATGPATAPATVPPAAGQPGSEGAPTAARGAALFRDPSLGTNGKSCATCHEGGKRLDPEELAEATDAKLAGYANSCIEGMLKGPRLPGDSARLRSMVLHLRTYQAKGR
jgi:cytochrome c peroxidase